MYDGEKPVEGEEQEGVDGGVGGDVGEVLYCLAPDASEGPRRQDIVGGGEGHTEHDKQEVSHGQTAWNGAERLC